MHNVQVFNLNSGLTALPEAPIFAHQYCWSSSAQKRISKHSMRRWSFRIRFRAGTRADLGFCNNPDDLHFRITSSCQITSLFLPKAKHPRSCPTGKLQIAFFCSCIRARIVKTNSVRFPQKDSSYIRRNVKVF